MDDVDKNRAFTAEELKNRLYHSLRQKGLVDSLKTQLRNTLVTELRDVSLSSSVSVDVPTCGENSLLLRAANSLVADHLQRCRYDYSLSVFLPEAGTAKDKIYSVRDLMQLLGVSPHSKVYQSLTNNVNEFNKKGFLWQLLCSVASLLGGSSQETSVQTDGPPLISESSLVDKLNNLDNLYSSMKDERFKHGILASEDRILAYQKSLEDRSRQEVKHEIARFRESELSRVRLQEREEARKEIEKLRREFEHTYQSKYDSLVARERNSIERLQKQQEITEKETYIQRQTVLGEIEAVRSREAQLRRDREVMDRESKLNEDRVKSKEMNIRERELAAKRKETDYENKVQSEMSRYKLEQESKYISKMKEIETREVRSREQARIINEEKESLIKIKEELKTKSTRLNELEAMHYQLKNDLLTSNKQGELMGEKIRGMVDYNILREENTVLRHELDDIKMRLAESRMENDNLRKKNEDLLREMADRLSKPTPQMMVLESELEKMRNALKEEQALAEYHKQQFDHRLQSEVNRNRELLLKFEQQTLQQKEMTREVIDTRAQLQQTQQALNNEVYRKPKSPVHNRSGPAMNTSQNQQTDGSSSNIDEFIDNLLAENSAGADLHLSGTSKGNADEYLAEMGLRRRNIMESSEDDFSIDIVEDTRKRLRSLEREADNLQQNYTNFQQRMTNVHSLPASVPASTHHVSFHTDSPSRKRQSNRSMQNSQSRPMSSTPHKHSGRAGVNSSRSLHSPPTQLQDENETDLPSFNVSHVSDSSDHSRSPISRSRAITLDDLEARPGSPNVLIVAASSSSSTPQSSTGIQSAQDASPAASNKTSGVSLDSAWKQQQQAAPSLDSAWKSQRDNDDERKRQEEEDRRWELKRKRKEEERKMEEEAAFEKEQKALQELSASKKHESADKNTEDKKKEEQPVEGNTAAAAPHTVDPMMQKYMDMVAKQKKQDNQIVKPIGNPSNQEKSPVVSEDLSQADDEKSINDVTVEDEDFW